jgi:hypothetical protein
MASTQYFDFIGSVWGLLSDEDKQRLGEVWQGIEQVVAASYQKFIEGNLNITTPNLQAYSTERWLPYTFDDENFIQQPAVFTSTQDLSLGINLTNKYLLRFSVDGANPVEINIRGVNSAQTFVPEIVAKINAGFNFKFARGVFENTVVQLSSSTSGINSTVEFLPTSIPEANACEFVLGILVSDLPLRVPEYPWVFSSPYPNLVEIPVLQDAIRDESVTETREMVSDYTVVANKNIAFKQRPLVKMWARRSLFDQENPWNNFGFLMDIYQKNSPRYVNVIQGLWFAFWTGPRPSNVRTALYLLFGLPTAQEDATVTAVTSSAITTTGKNGTVRSFLIPSGLVAIVTLGQAVKHFDPLVSGIDVFDKVNRPGFIADEIGREGIGRFLTDQATRGPGDTDETKALRMLEEYTFLPQISVDSFIYPDINLGNVKIFLDAIKPLNKTYLFQVIVGNFRDQVGLLERLGQDYTIDITPNLDSNQTTFLSSDDLTTYEAASNLGLDLDSEGMLVGESVAVEVYQGAALIDSFTA